MAGHTLFRVFALLLGLGFRPCSISAETLKVVALYGKYTGLNDHYKQILTDAESYLNDPLSSNIVSLPPGDQVQVIDEQVLRNGKTYEGQSLSQTIYSVCNNFRSTEAAAIILSHDLCEQCFDISGIIGDAYSPVITLDPADESQAIKMRPALEDIAEMLVDVIDHFKWKDYILLFEGDGGMIMAETLTAQAVEHGWNMVQVEIDEDFREQTKDLMQRSVTNILVFVTNEEILVDIVNIAFEERLMTNGWHWMFGNVNPPISKQFLETQYRHNMAFLTRFKMVANELQYFSTIAKPIRSWSFRERAAYDALVLIAYASTLHRQREGTLPRPVPSCGRSERSTLERYLKEVSFRGASGDIAFDADGNRVNYTINMFSGKDRFAENLAGFFVQDIRSWEQAHRQKWPGKPGKRMYIKPFRQADVNYIKIVAVEEPPFFMEKGWEAERYPENNRLFRNRRQSFDSETYDSEDEPYSGIAWELIKKIKVVMEDEMGVDFKFRISVHNRGQYGSLDLSTGEWDGMIRELIDGDADVAIGAITKNSARENDIDFTTPWYKSQLKMMILHPSWTFEYPFSLVYPMHITAWFALLIIFVIMCILVALIGYFSPYEWRQRAKRGEVTEEEMDTFSLKESVFYVLSTAFLQSYRRGPRSWSLRVLSAFWFWFALCIVFIYGSNVNKVMKFSKTAIKLKDTHDLMAQDVLKFGAIRNSPSYDFYRYNKGIYRSVFDRMLNSEENLIEDRLEHAAYRIRRQWDGRYAVLGEEKILHYAADRKPCRLFITGKTFGKIQFSLAVPSGSPLRDQLTYAIKILKKRGDIEKILEMEWSDKLRCSGTTIWEKETKKSFTIHDLQGLYYLMFIGLGGSVIIFILEWLFFALFMDEGWKARGSVGRSIIKKKKKHDGYSAPQGGAPGMSDGQDWL